MSIYLKKTATFAYMKLIGITGYIGSGKTTACQIFEHLGIPVYYSDYHAKNAYLNPHIQQQITKALHTDVFRNGILQKELLANIIFSQPEKLAMVNAIIHPYIRQHFQQWCTLQRSPYLLFESAILFQSDIHQWFDDIILVHTPKEELYNRIQYRNGWSRQEIEQRLQKQCITPQAVKLCKYVAYNDENRLLIPQILQIHAQITATI